MSQNTIHKKGAIYRAREFFKVLKGRDMTQDELDRLELKRTEDSMEMEGQLRIHADGSATFLSPRLDGDYPAKIRSDNE